MMYLANTYFGPKTINTSNTLVVILFKDYKLWRQDQQV